LSPDLKFLALSDRSRGGIWDLTGNSQVYNARGFSGGYFETDGTFYGDFRGYKGIKRSVSKMDPKSPEPEVAYKLEEDSIRELGHYLILEKSNKPGGNPRDNGTLDVRDIVSGKSLWTRQFPQGMPSVFVDS